MGKTVTTSTTVDANLNHCLATGRSVTGCLHFVNHTPIDSYSKRQATVATAAYGSEFVASKTATEQIIDVRHTLIYLGVLIKTKSYLFGDNRSVVTSSTLPHSPLGKRHNILAYHQVREAIVPLHQNFLPIIGSGQDTIWVTCSANTGIMIMKLLITRGHITLIPKDATQDNPS